VIIVVKNSSIKVFSEYGHLLNVLVLLTTTLLDKVFKVTLNVLVMV